jgi:hypothetical protein
MGGKGSGRPVTVQCGTPAGYRKHKRHKQDACQPCKDAWAAHYRKGTKRAKLPKHLRADHIRTANNYSIVREWKLAAGKCMDCGFIITEETVVCIDCDHRDPQEKTFTISYVMGRITAEELLAELTKCDPVCRNCHALRTHRNKHHLARRPHTTTPTLFDA